MTVTLDRKRRRDPVDLPEEETPRAASMKRGHLGGRKVKEKTASSISLLPEFLEQCRKNFTLDSRNLLARNAIVTVGTLFAATDTEEARKINHLFLNTLKPPDCKATNQEFSGRCWLFAGLNMFRHHVTRALNLKNFEFSQTYLFFWDKIEKSNRFLVEIMEHLDTPIDDRYLSYILKDPIGDGGYWNMFATLVEKYGLLSKEGMPETWHSSDSEEINVIINERLHATACYLRENRRRLKEKDMDQVKADVLKQIYNILVKFLGPPPETFTWSYSDDEDATQIIEDMTPQRFKNTILPGINLSEFIVLAHFPHKDRPFNQPYVFRYSSNIAEEAPFKCLNVSIQDLKKYAAASIIKGQPVWFGADMDRGFHPYKNALDEKLVDYDLLFGETRKLDKAHRLEYSATSCCHAMCLTGVDFSSDGKPKKWQVENSWGYWDEKTPGQDGFLMMTDAWFEENVFQVVIHKNFLSRATVNALKKEPILVEPWDPMGQVLRIP
jgi:bleomycin hydrolase